jgi:hypothetical protein
MWKLGRERSLKRDDAEVREIDRPPNAGRGTRAAVVGAVMGLVTVAVLGVLIFLSDEPGFAVHFAGKIALILVYASPYLFALAASRAERPGTRGGLLLAFGLLSLVASFSSLVSPITLVLLPATFAILFAAARSLTASIRPLTATLTAAVLGLAVAATVGLSLYTLFGVQDPETRCWVLTLSADGEYVWEDQRPNLSDPDTLTVSLSGGNIRSICSEIITNAEAGMSAGVLAVAFLEMLLISRFRWLWSPNSGRVWAAK